MPTDTLFAHLAHRFSTHPENLATEALAYLLGRGEPALLALRDELARTGVKLPSALQIRTQAAGGDGAIPDMIGVCEDGDSVLVVEAKFWAGLTENQPLTYIERLPASGASMLVFIAPALRFATLPSEIWRRCTDGGIEIQSPTWLEPDFCWCPLAENSVLAVLSWRRVLNVITAALSANGLMRLASDAEQLMGLCNRMDDSAFLPLSSTDLAPDHGRRVQNFCSLVDDATSLLVEKKLASTQGLRASASAGWYGRYITLAEHGACLSFSADRWARLAETPIWLSVKDRDWRYSDDVRQALAPLRRADPTKLLSDDEGRILVPISIPLGVEKHDVVARIVDQVTEVRGLLVKFSADQDSSTDRGTKPARNAPAVEQAHNPSPDREDDLANVD